MTIEAKHLTDINRQDIIDLRGRINDLEEQVTKNNVRMGVITTIIALAVPSIITIAPNFIQ